MPSRPTRIVPALGIFALSAVLTGGAGPRSAVAGHVDPAEPSSMEVTAEVARASETAVASLDTRVRRAVALAGFSHAHTEPGPTPTQQDPTEVDWRMLAGLNYRTGEMTDELKAVVGGEAKVPGFMVPLEDYLEEVTEFLLVPYVGACVHTPPPPPNQLVYVKMAEGRRVAVEWWDPIYTVGTLILDETENQYASVSYTMEAQQILPYEN